MTSKQQQVEEYAFLGPVNSGEHEISTSVISNKFDAENEQRIGTLLQDWGRCLTSADSLNAAKQEVIDFRHRQQEELFVFNPYRPQQGQGFPGKPMWTNLMAEMASFGNVLSKTSNRDEDIIIRKHLAKIFRVDESHNEMVLRQLSEQDKQVEEKLTEILQ